MKTLTEFINERLIINKNYHFDDGIPVPQSLNEKDIKNAWDDIFDNIKQFKNNCVKLGRIKLISTKPSHYEKSVYKLYPNENGKIIIRRTTHPGVSIWISENTIEEVTKKMEKFLSNEGYQF